MQHVGLRLRGRRACPGAQERDHKAGSLEHGFLLGGAALPTACPQQVAYFPTMKELTRSSERSLRNCKAAPDEGAQDQRSGASALSCQWRSSRWLSSVSSRKIAMPVAETSTSAANMRGILSW